MKDFKKWHGLKSHIHNSTDDRPFFYEREIWFCYMGENVGFEQDGKGDSFLRPVMIIRKFNHEIFWGIPLTSKLRHTIHYAEVTMKNGLKGSVILSQLRLMDAKRLSHRIEVIPHIEFSVITKKLKDLIP
jgi:PemK-like, MazF-like toxin of type II toxin-antitoxin system